jgi:hypothetical protein
MAVPMLRSISAHKDRVPVFDAPVKMKKSRRDAGARGRNDAQKNEAPGSRRTRGLLLRA